MTPRCNAWPPSTRTEQAELSINPALVGLSIVLSLTLAKLMEQFIQQYANMETAFNSVERIQARANVAEKDTSHSKRSAVLGS